ncbi:MAG: hypothetical protein H7Z71_10420 [Moraxellaceae bacterium]|nr:hypothetical protein [Pseudobdellovibrionaceae bacterium]
MKNLLNFFSFLFFSILILAQPAKNHGVNQGQLTKSKSAHAPAPAPKERVYADSLNVADNEFLESLSVETPKLSDMPGYDGEPLGSPPDLKNKGK